MFIWILKLFVISNGIDDIMIFFKKFEKLVKNVFVVIGWLLE